MRFHLLATCLLLPSALLIGCGNKSSMPDHAELTTGDELSVAHAQAAPDVPIPNAQRTDQGLLVGGQPSEAQFKALAEAGYRTVISLRTEGEKGSEGEADVVHALGMRFVSIPVAGADGLTLANAQALAIELAAVDTAPAVVHCGTGNRAGALLGLKVFAVDRVEPELAIEFAKQVGMTSLEPALRERIRELCKADPAYACPSDWSSD